MLTIIFKTFKFFIIIFANFFILLIIDTNMKKALTFLMMTLMMAAVTTIISQTHEVYAENKAKDLCSQYDGEWNNGKCKIKNEDTTDYEDELCDDTKDTNKYPKICKDN
jgi:hypothetical protein